MFFLSPSSSGGWGGEEHVVEDRFDRWVWVGPYGDDPSLFSVKNRVFAARIKHLMLS